MILKFQIRRDGRSARLRGPGNPAFIYIHLVRSKQDQKWSRWRVFEKLYVEKGPSFGNLHGSTNHPAGHLNLTR
jgi:hypothetical protein